MKSFFRKKIIAIGIYSTLVIGWIITMACFGGGIPDPPQNETVYARVGSFPAYISNNVLQELINAEIQANTYSDDLEYVVTNPYSGSSHLYLEYGVSTTYCTDHDHTEAIEVSGSKSGVGFIHNVQYSGTMWLQFISQCEDDFDSNFDNGDGAYWKGSQWYAAYDYPNSLVEASIAIDLVFVTNCIIPEYPAEEYGCGADDLN